MQSVESLGLGSGVLTSDLVEQLITAEREVSDIRLDSRQELTEAKITAYGEIQSLMADIQSSANKLSSPSLVGATQATSSDESILTATTTSVAEPGSYSVEVVNTAKAHALASQTYSSFDEVVGTGKLVFSFGAVSYDGSGDISGQDINGDRITKSITIDDSNRSLSGIRDAINNADMGVTATIVNDGSGYRLLMTSSETGVENAMRIEAQDESGNLLTSGLATLAFNENQLASSAMTQTAGAQDASLMVNGLTITRSSNVVEEVIPGVALNLNGADVGKTVNITVSADTEELTETLQGFVDTYNQLKTFVDDLSSYNTETQQAGLLLGDSTIRSMMTQLRALISEPVVGLGGKYRSLTELGVNTDRNNDYQLTFDTSIFNRALTEDRTSIIGLLAKSGVTTDSQITYVNDSINTRPGTYDVEITQLATQARYDGQSLALLDFSSPVVIDESSNNFNINVNGTNSEITLTQGSYTSGDALAKEIALQINSSNAVSAAGHSVSVAYDNAARNFSVTSNQYGSSSRISFASVDANVANVLGFTASGQGAYQGVGLTTLNADAFNGKGATSLQGQSTVDEDEGINFAASNATFSLNIDGAGPVAVVVNQDASGQDLNGDGIYGDRKDTLQAVQSAIDAQPGLNGLVTASFDAEGYLRFETTAEGSARSIEVSATGIGTGDILLGLDGTQGVQTNGKDPGVTFAAPVEFAVQVDGVDSLNKVSVPAGNYLSGDALAAEIQNQIGAVLSSDPNFTGVVKGAETAVASRDISAPIDFSAANSGFILNVSGNEQEIIVSGNSGNNIADIQSALDAAYGAGVVTASLDGSGLKLTTVASGHEEYIEVESDGRGARSAAFADLSAGIDFSGGQNATFTLTVDGLDINVDVNGDGTAGGNNSESNLTVIQQAIDSALVNSGQFAAGDVRARVNDSGQLYFETQRKDGVRTAATFGASSSVEVKNLGGTAATSLGMSAGVSTNGYDGFGLATNERNFGYDLDVTVDYEYDPDKLTGAFNISVGGLGTSVRFTDLDPAAISALGLQDAAVYSPAVAVGQDVAGKINGIEATGTGQFLRAVDGNQAATNGYYLGDLATDFSTPVTIDATNNVFTIEVDGVEAEVTLNQPAVYNSGTSLALALQQAINDTTAFSDEDIRVRVDYTTDTSSYAYGRFGIISASTGASSDVQIKDVSSGVAEVFGFTLGRGDGEAGKDQVGFIDDASGLRLKVTGGEPGMRGQVTYISGFGDQLKEIMDGFLNGRDSMMSVRQAALDDDLTDIDEEREKLDARMEAREARLRSQFLYNDAIIQTLNSTLDFVQQQFDAMNGNNDN